MNSQSKPSFFAAPADAELEWLLCLAAALQARQKKPVEFAPECRPIPGPTFRSRLQDKLKGLRGTQRIPAA